MTRPCLSALVLLVPALAGAGVRPRYGGELRVFLPAAPTELDPTRALAVADLVAARASGATLLEVDGRGALRPALLEALPEREDGGRAFRLRLAPGLSFHDGEPLTAARVAESLASVGAPGSPSAFLVASIAGARAVRDGRTRTLSGVEVISERELRIELGYAFPGFPAALATLPTAIVHPRPGGEPSGAGPFRPVEKGPKGLRLEPFEAFFGGRPFVDAAVLSGAEARLAARALAAGDVEAVVRPEASLGPTRMEVPPVGLVVAVVSRRLGPLAEPTRSALAALDRADLARLVRAPARPLPSLLPPEPGSLSRGSPPAAVPPPGRPPARLGLLLPDTADSPRVAAARLQVKLYDRGVRVALESVPPPAFAARLFSGDFDTALVPVWLLSRAPALVLSQVASAVGGYEQGAAVLERAAACDEGRLPALAAALETELLVVPLYASGLRVGARDGVEGLLVRDDGTLDLGDAWLMPERGGP